MGELLQNQPQLNASNTSLSAQNNTAGTSRIPLGNCNQQMQASETNITTTVNTGIQTTDSLAVSLTMVSGTSSSSSSVSEQYLTPIDTTRESNASGYEYADVAPAPDNAEPFIYFGLGSRPPQRPNVYDRLRQSRLSSDMETSQNNAE